MIGWMFPGQPIAVADTFVHDPGFQVITRLCQDVTGYDPISGDASASDLSTSVRLQLFGACTSLYRTSQLTSQGRAPDLIAEHSMGIYSALAACGSIDAATALALTCRIGQAMTHMACDREYALGCVIGLTCGPLKAITDNNGVYIANHNTSRHFLLAGVRKQVESAVAEATAAGAFSVSVFPCDAPLHTPLIGEISNELQRIVSCFSFLEPVIPLIEHIEQTRLTAATIPGFLVDELCRPVYWESTYRALRLQRVTRFEEVGVGSALTKFNRWIDSDS